MKKLVLKTVLITLASIIGAALITFGAMSIFAPGTVAGFFDDLGNYSASVFFYEKEYIKSGDIDDLVVLIDKAYAENDGARTEEYLSELIGHKDFSDYCATKDAENSGGLSTEDYYNELYELVKSNNGN